VLSAGGDDDLLGFAAHPPCGPQIVADACAQLDQTGGIGVAEVVRSQPADGAMRQPAPGLGGMRIDQRAAGVERASARRALLRAAPGAVVMRGRSSRLR
jgi:hypothetical protein